MAAGRDKVLAALDRLVVVTKEHERDQTPHYSQFALQHLDFWKNALGPETDVPEIKIDELNARIADADRLLKGHTEDFEHAVIDAFSASLNMYRGLPGGRQVPPPMPSPKPRHAPARAFEE
jgi:hypothetical protein